MYRYIVRVEVVRDGNAFQRTMQVVLHAGAHTSVVFDFPNIVSEDASSLSRREHANPGLTTDEPSLNSQAFGPRW